MIRALVHLHVGSPASPTTIAEQVGVSQPRVSQVFRKLGELSLIERTDEKAWRPRREALTDRFLADYPGPGGAERHYYSLDTPNEVAVAAANLATSGRDLAISADVAADLLVAWRRPTTTILYWRSPPSTADLRLMGLLPAHGRDDANVVLREPSDLSVFPIEPMSSKFSDVDVPLVDPLQIIWDLQWLGGADRIEAAGRLREWLLNRP